MNLGVGKASLCFKSTKITLNCSVLLRPPSASPQPCSLHSAPGAHSPLLHIPLPAHPLAHPSASRSLCLGICSCRTSLARSRLFLLLLLPSAGLRQRQRWRPGKCPLPFSLLSCLLLPLCNSRGPQSPIRGASTPQARTHIPERQLPPTAPLTGTASPALRGDRTCVTAARH